MLDDEPPRLGKIILGEDFHDQFHPPFTCRWHGYPRGSWRLHLRYAWKFRWAPELRAQTRCRLGWHRITKSWRRPDAEAPFVMEWRCADCAHRPVHSPPRDRGYGD